MKPFLDFCAKIIQALIRDVFCCAVVSGKYDAKVELMPYITLTYEEEMAARAEFVCWGYIRCTGALGVSSSWSMLPAAKNVACNLR